MSSPRTLIDLLHRCRAVEERGVAVYDRRGTHCARLSWAEMAGQAARFAHWARDRGVGPGDTVMLSLPTSTELLAGWLGALLLGARPLCLALPRAIGGEAAFHRRLDRLWTYLDGPFLLAADWLAGQEHAAVAEAHGRVAAAPALDGQPELSPAEWVAPDPEATAFFQLTSGSTAFPKAVKISHRAVLANCVAIQRASSLAPGDASVGWLPLNHDMGLVGLMLTALHTTVDLVLLRPETFLARPRSWLEALTRHGGTHSAAPDFAYRYCAERIPEAERAGLDLSRWRVACTGAETIWESTIDAFCRAFERVGFRRSTFLPCYGLAETTLATAMADAATPPRIADFPAGVAGQRARRLISVGRPVYGLAVQIRGERGEPLDERREGEIAIRGDSLFSGYHGDSAATESLFDGEWLLTGDLGVLDQGELFVTGRKKDIIKVAGQTFGAQELEHLAAEVIDFPEGRQCAFAVGREEGERAVLVVEAPDDEPERLARWERAIRDAVGRDLGVGLEAVAFVKRGSIPKTSSGKTQRRAVRERFESGLPLDRPEARA